MKRVVDVLVVGGGPAGLSAATELSGYNCSVLLIESMPTIGRKFLMAGKSGLNITTAKDDFLAQYGESEKWITPIIKNFGPDQIIAFCQLLGQEVFEGSSGKIFPKSMKTSPLLRSWLSSLKRAGVEIQTSSRWIDFYVNKSFSERNKNLYQRVRSNGKDYFITSKATILALGGASWCRLGSDGKWSTILQKYLTSSNTSIIPFSAANMGLNISWSQHMMKYQGLPAKSIAVKVNGEYTKGEFIITRTGVEGGVIYLLSTMQKGKLEKVEIDLLPDLSTSGLCKKLERNRGKLSKANFLRRVLGLHGVKFGILREFGYPFPEKALEFAKVIKNLEVKIKSNCAMDYAISTKGGIAKDAVNSDLMLNDLSSVFCAGEMLDWTAPTGGGLLTGCFSTGSHAGKSVAKYLNLKLTI